MEGDTPQFTDSFASKLALFSGFTEVDMLFGALSSEFTLSKLVGCEYGGGGPHIYLGRFELHIAERILWSGLKFDGPFVTFLWHVALNLSC